MEHNGFVTIPWLIGGWGWKVGDPIVSSIPCAVNPNDEDELFPLTVSVCEERCKAGKILPALDPLKNPNVYITIGRCWYGEHGLTLINGKSAREEIILIDHPTPGSYSTPDGHRVQFFGQTARICRIEE
jgi:hypothetical protein